MTTYSAFMKKIEQEKEEVICECVNPVDYKPKHIFVFPGGGISAVLFTLGVYKALHTAGLLLDNEGELNRDNVFIASSGGVIPGLLIANCINLKLTRKLNWFETYVETPISKLSPFTTIDMYVTTQIRSFLTETLANCFFDDWSYLHLDEIVKHLVPNEMIGKKGICYLSNYLADHFKFNYIKIVGTIPYMTDNHKDTSQMTVLEQFKTIFGSCCTINGLSYTRFFQNHDAAIGLNNHINCIFKYMDNMYIRNVFYYTLTSYDAFSYNSIILKNNIKTYKRDRYEQNYFVIRSIESECMKRNKNFSLIGIPNKFNILQKFDVAIYNELQQRINYTSDFIFLERFLGAPLFHRTSDFQKVITLFGYYETLYIVKEINAFNRKKQSEFQNVEIVYLNTLVLDDNKIEIKKKKGNLFNLTPEQIVQAVSAIKYSNDDIEPIIAKCFNDYCGCREKSAAFLIEYLTMMQGYEYEYEKNKEKETNKYNELFPITKMSKRLIRKPEKYLNKEYKRVSKDVVNVYFPSFAEKLRNSISYT